MQTEMDYWDFVQGAPDINRHKAGIYKHKRTGVYLHTEMDQMWRKSGWDDVAMERGLFSRDRDNYWHRFFGSTPEEAIENRKAVDVAEAMGLLGFAETKGA